MKRGGGVWASQIRPPTARITGRQYGYLFLHAIGPMLIGAAINFGIQTAVYNNTKPINLFPFPNTIAGDMVVTLLIQVVLTWFIEGLIVWGDLHRGWLVPPIAPEALGCLCACNRGYYPVAAPAQGAATNAAAVRPRTRVGGAGSWIATLEDLVHRYPAGQPMTAYAADGATAPQAGGGAPAPAFATPANRGRLFLSNLLRALVWFVILFIPVWGLGVGITAAIWGATNYNHFPQVPLIFAVYGGAIGLVFGPIVTLIALTTAGRYWQLAAAGGAVPGAAAAAVPMQQQGQQYAPPASAVTGASPPDGVAPAEPLLVPAA